jgi:uncharacterized protein (DUF1684 family)
VISNQVLFKLNDNTPIRHILSLSGGKDSTALAIYMKDRISIVQETYGAGHYLEPVALEGNRFLIDFNYTYNPYCAYNERWFCPIPPLENRLKVSIRAGEKVFTGH